MGGGGGIVGGGMVGGVRVAFGDEMAGGVRVAFGDEMGGIVVGGKVGGVGGVAGGAGGAGGDYYRLYLFGTTGDCPLNLHTPRPRLNRLGAGFRTNAGWSLDYDRSLP